MKPAILLLSGGSLVGENVIDALAARRDDLRLIATNTQAWAPSLARVDRVVLVPPTAGHADALLAAVESLVTEEQVALVIPCRDDDVVWLSHAAPGLRALGAGAPVGRPEAIRHIADKWLSAVFSVDHGLPFARSAPADDPARVQVLLSEVGWPLLVKPRAGFASGGVRILRTAAQLESVLGHSSLLLQEYLGCPQELARYLDDLERLGPPLFHSFEEAKYSLQAFIDPAGAVVAHLVTRHAMKQGKSASVELLNAPELDQLALRIANAFGSAGWRGPLNAQCQKRPDGSYAIYEYNGRFTGATSARALLGYDEVGMAMEAFGEIAQRSSKPLQSGAKVIRSPRSSLQLP